MVRPVPLRRAGRVRRRRGLGRGLVAGLAGEGGGGGERVVARWRRAAGEGRRGQHGAGQLDGRVRGARIGLARGARKGVGGLGGDLEGRGPQADADRADLLAGDPAPAADERQRRAGAGLGVGAKVTRKMAGLIQVRPYLLSGASPPNPWAPSRRPAAGTLSRRPASRWRPKATPRQTHTHPGARRHQHRSRPETNSPAGNSRLPPVRLLRTNKFQSRSAHPFITTARRWAASLPATRARRVACRRPGRSCLRHGLPLQQLASCPLQGAHRRRAGVAGLFPSSVAVKSLFQLLAGTSRRFSERGPGDAPAGRLKDALGLVALALVGDDTRCCLLAARPVRPHSRGSAARASPGVTASTIRSTSGSSSPRAATLVGSRIWRCGPHGIERPVPLGLRALARHGGGPERDRRGAGAAATPSRVRQTRRLAVGGREQDVDHRRQPVLRATVEPQADLVPQRLVLRHRVYRGAVLVHESPVDRGHAADGRHLVGGRYQCRRWTEARDAGR